MPDDIPRLMGEMKLTMNKKHIRDAKYGRLKNLIVKQIKETGQDMNCGRYNLLWFRGRDIIQESSRKLSY